MKQRGGIQNSKAAEIMSQTEGDLNRFYNYYLEKALPNYNGVLATEVPSGPGVTNSMMVIDMQNDFVFPAPQGAFSVAGGDNIINPMVDFIQKNATKCTKVIFSRDSHDKEHCSFQAHNGPFPEHCVINTPGAEMHADMMPLSSLENAKVIFKGMSPNVDSFGALQYPDDEYSVGRQIGPECCAESKTSKKLGGCSSLTGGFYLNNLSTVDAFGPKPFASGWESNKTQFDVKDLIGGQTSGTHNVFVMGLAGDYCVRDTAINIAKATKGGVNGVTFNVFVIQPLCRYAFVPLFVGVVPPNYVTITPGDITDATPGKDLSKYAFKGTGKNATIITNKDELKTITADEIGSDKNMKFGYSHFLTDPTHILQNYKDAGVKMLMNVPVLADKASGGRRKKTRRHRTRRAKKTRGRSRRY
jgi:nicotinamidase-related amidase